VPTPYTNAAAAYAKTAGDGASSLSAVRTTLVEACHRRADYLYLVGKLERFKAERVGIPAPAKSMLPWEKYFEATEIMHESPTKHCASVERAAQGFSLGASALGAYASALGSLADAGKGIGASMGSIGEDAAKLAKSIEGNDKASGAIKTAASVTGTLTDLVIGQRKEEDLHAFVAQADPHVQKLSAALLEYLDAVQLEVDASLEAESSAVAALESLTGLGAESLLPPPPAPPPTASSSVPPPAASSAAPPRPAPPAANKGVKGAVVTPLGPTVFERDIESRLDAIERKIALGPQGLDGARLITFFQLARETAAEDRKVRETVAAYRGVLERIKSAHGALVKAGDEPDKKSWSDFLKELSDLAQRLSDVRGKKG
jgi:hypothetical protein